jgi:dsRNA-specific ribonuclease
MDRRYWHDLRRPTLNDPTMTTPKLPDPLPELPYLDAAIALDVYAHRSLHYEGKPVNEEYGDNRRLAILGEAVLNMAVTQRLFYQKPLKTAEMIEVSLRCTVTALYL